MKILNRDHAKRILLTTDDIELEMAAREYLAKTKSNKSKKPKLTLEKVLLEAMA